jgi:hypothetical protein
VVEFDPPGLSENHGALLPASGVTSVFETSAGPRLSHAEHPGRFHPGMYGYRGGRSLPGLRVTRVLDRLEATVGLP